jgi:glutamyl-tRNA synthetase
VNVFARDHAKGMSKQVVCTVCSTPPRHPTSSSLEILTALFNANVNMESQIKEWQDRAEALKPLNLKQIEGPLGELDAHLTLRSHIVGYTITDADTTVWKTLRENRVAHAYIKQNLMPNLCRWFRYIEEAYPQQATLPERSAKGKDDKSGKEKKGDDGANYDIGLQDVGDGTGVVTRFPPEPS